MKRHHHIPAVFARTTIAAFALAIAANLRADVAGSGNASTNSPVALGTSITSVGPHSRTWTVAATNQANGGATTNVATVQEIGTGLNFWDGTQWSPSDTSFQITQGGTLAVVNTTQCKVSIASDLAVTNAVTVITPDGLTLNSSPLSIGLFDAASGNATIIGTITNCTGWLVSSNQLVFTNAFDGVCANVVFTVEKGAFHQDVVITGKLDPADWGYPTNTTRIQVLTEFYNPPTPSRMLRPIQIEQDPNLRNTMASPDLVDQVLTFGELTFNTGRAYTAASTNFSKRRGELVGKQLTTVSNRTFLIESVPYSWLQAELQSLPTCQAPGGGSGQGAMLNAKKAKAAYAAIPTLPGRGQTTAIIKRRSERLAGVPGKRAAGVVIDYEASISGTNNGPLQSDTTYFVSSTVYCSSPVVIEGGAVFKFPYATGADIQIDSALTITASSYKPAVFTAADDNTVGTTLNTSVWSGFTGVIQGNNYADPALYLNSGNAATINNIRVNFAAQGVYINAMHNDYTWTVSHSQFLNCVQGIEMDKGSFAALKVNNCLMGGVQSVISDADTSCGTTFSLCNATIDTTTNILSWGGSPLAHFTNCVFENATNSTTYFAGDHNGFYQSSQFGTAQYVSTVYPCQSVGAGNYYLTNGSTFRNVGTTNIDSGLLAALSAKTTYPPEIVSNVTFTVSDTMWPQASRDNAGTLDLGYHYDPIDYIVDLFVITNATLTLTNGVALACFNDSAGIWLQDGSSLVSFGSPLNPNWLLHYNTVQEQAVQIGSVSESSMSLLNSYHYGNIGPNGTFRFTRFVNLGGVGQHFYATTSWAYSNLWVQDCEFLGAGNNLCGDTNADRMVFLNNLFERSPVYASSPYSAPGLVFTNNLAFGAQVTISAPTAGAWYAFDNAFDSCFMGRASSISNGYNAYLNTTNRLTPTNINDYVSSSSLAWQTGPLGRFYQPTNSLLLGAGNTSASNVFLYHYTDKTNQVIEGTNIVSLGYHYVALNGSGQPDDMGGSGIPDYLADSNGNGIYDPATDLSNWKTNSTAGDGISDLTKYLLGLNIKVNSSTTPAWFDTNGVVNLQVYTPLK